jgi:secondary thiamine-phosphate synthase enzyme
MKTFQRKITLPEYPRGFHIITKLIENKMPELKEISTGIASIFIQHTSASLCINENVDPTVRQDFESHFNTMVPENAPYFKHTLEGPDDMPAHIKAAMLGFNLTIPITHGSFNLGTWQGIYLCEHRNNDGKRNLIVTLFGS